MRHPPHLSIVDLLHALTNSIKINSTINAFQMCDKNIVINVYIKLYLLESNADHMIIMILDAIL